MFIYEMYFSFLDSFQSYQTSAIVASLSVAIPLVIGFLIYSMSLCLPPGTNITYTADFIYKDIRNSKLKVVKRTSANKKMQENEDKLQHEDIEREWIEVSYRRLGKTKIYEDYLSDCKTWSMMLTVVGISLLICSFILNVTIFLPIGALLAVIGPFVGDKICNYMLKSSISALNARQKIELPKLASRFMSVINNIGSNPLNKVLEIYLQHAGALRYDIEMTLSDIRSYGQLRALSMWQKRATMYNQSTMVEFTMFCEKLKKLYSQGDELYVRTELAQIQRTIDEKYTMPLILKQCNGKIRNLMILMVLSFAVLAFFMMLPMIIEISGALTSVSM